MDVKGNEERFGVEGGQQLIGILLHAPPPPPSRESLLEMVITHIRAG